MNQQGSWCTTPGCTGRPLLGGRPQTDSTLLVSAPRAPKGRGPKVERGMVKLAWKQRNNGGDLDFARETAQIRDPTHRGDPPSKSKYYSMTDSVQVPWGKDEKNPNKGVKKNLKSNIYKQWKRRGGSHPFYGRSPRPWRLRSRPPHTSCIMGQRVHLSSKLKPRGVRRSQHAGRTQRTKDVVRPSS